MCPWVHSDLMLSSRGGGRGDCRTAVDPRHGTHCSKLLLQALLTTQRPATACKALMRHYAIVNTLEILKSKTLSLEWWSRTEPRFTSDATRWARDWKFSGCCISAVAAACVSVAVLADCSLTAAPLAHCSWDPLALTSKLHFIQRKVLWRFWENLDIFVTAVTEFYCTAVRRSAALQTSFALNIALSSLHMLSSLFIPLLSNSRNLLFRPTKKSFVSWGISS